MANYRLDGRTALITGAGGNPSLGRAHAMLLAKLGANVVVNDIGAGAETPNYPYPASAEAVAEEIRAAGGKAVADSNSVATFEGAEAMIQTALDAFGSIDILVNNAAFSITALFEELTPKDFERHISVNLLGTAWTCKVAWPHMKAAGRGRIVNIASGAIAGGAGVAAYAASKGGIFSLTRSLASEGAPHGIKANSVNPGGFSRLVMATQQEGSYIYELAKSCPAELSSPVVAFLAHDACPVTGECIDAVAGMARRVYLAQTEGFMDPNLTIDMLAERWDEVMAGVHASIIGYGGLEIFDGAQPYDPATRD
jgi:NAD(P)-dependent dehydrogenase (short-subunit alcohol dehydrogenase family)